MAKLMLVEDDNNLREIYEARLQAEGYTIVSARDGEEALVVAKAEKPDLIISDVMMPKISGFEMLDILRNTEGLKEVKVIMLTALGQNDDQQRADRLGADRYLVKSQVTLEDIVKVAHDLLNDAPASGGAATEAAAAAPDPAAPATAAPEPATPAPAAAAPAAAPDTQVTDVPVAEPPAEPAATPVPPPAPAPEPPAAAVTPAPATDGTAAAATDAVPAAAPVAETEAAEAADVESKIENFVAGATEEPTAPEPVASPAAAAPTPAPSPAPTPAPTPPPAADPKAATDDKVMEEAVKNLSDSAEAAAKGEDGPSGAPIVITPTEPASPAPAPAPTTQPAAEEPHMGGQKVIQPLDESPKKGIDQLLAEEEAKTDAPTEPAKPVVADNGQDDGKVDPHSIAL